MNGLHSRGHTCPGPDCQAQIPFNKLACARHWAQVPPPLQRAVYATWGRGRGGGGPRHRAALDAAVEAMAP